MKPDTLFRLRLLYHLDKLLRSWNNDALGIGISSLNPSTACWVKTDIEIPLGNPL